MKLKTIQVYLLDRFIMVVQNVSQDYINSIIRQLTNSPYDYKFIVY